MEEIYRLISDVGMELEELDEEGYIHSSEAWATFISLKEARDQINSILEQFNQND